MDTQDVWDREDTIAALSRVRDCQAALETQEKEAEMLRAKLKHARKKVTEAQWKLAEAIRVAARSLGQSK